MPGGSHLADQHENQGGGKGGGGGKAALAAAHAAAQMGHAATAAAAGYTSAVSAPPGGGPTPSYNPPSSGGSKPYKPPPDVTRTISDTGKAAKPTVGGSVFDHPKKEIRRQESDAYKQEATQRLIEQTWATDKNGKPIMQKAKAPILKKNVTQKQVSRASENLDATLDRIQNQVNPHRFRKIKAVESYRLGQKLYKTDKKGVIKQQTIKQPKLTVSDDRYEKKVSEINRTARHIAQGTHGEPKNPLKHPQDNTPWVNEDKRWRVQVINPILKGKVDDEEKAIIKDQISQGNYQDVSDLVDTGGITDLSEQEKLTLKSALEAKDAHDFMPTLEAKAKEAADPGFLGDAVNFIKNTYEGGIGVILDRGDEETDKLTNALSKVVAGSSARAPLVEAGILPEANLKKLYDETAGGLSKSPMQYGFELALRPGALAETALARRMEDLGFDVEGDIPSLKDVALHGYEAKDAPTGASLLKAIDPNVPAQAGLLVDILADPLTYVGAGGVVSKTAAKAATLELKIAKEAPEILEGAQYKALLKGFKENGDSEQLYKYLSQVAKDNKISTSKLNPLNIALQRTVNRGLRGKGKLAERFNLKDQDELIAQIKRQTEDSPSVSFPSGHRPMQVRLGGTGRAEGTAGRDIGGEIIRSQRLQQALDPGFELRLNTPLGSRIAGFKLPGSGSRYFPMPKSLLRTGVHGPAVEGDIKDMRRAEALGPVEEKYKAQLDGMDAQIEKAKVQGADQVTLNALARRRNALARERERAIHEAKDIPDVTGPFGKGKLTPKEYTTAINRRKVAHALQRTSLSQARREEQHMQEVLKRSGILDLDQVSRDRVMAYQHERYDVGEAIHFGEGKPLGKLDPAEQHAVDTLDTLYREIGKSDVTTGILEQQIDDYVARVPTEQSDALLKDITGGTSEGSTAAFQHGRVITEGSGLEDPMAVAARLRSASQHPNAQTLSATESENLADELFQSGHMRNTTEGLLQRVERRGSFGPDELGNLTALQKKALLYQGVRLEERNGKVFASIDPSIKPGIDSGGKGLFDVTDEGQLVIKQGLDKHLPTYTPDLFVDAPKEQRWAAAMAHKNRLDNLIAKAPDSRHIDDLKAQRAQVEQELKDIDFRAGELEKPTEEASARLEEALAKRDETAAKLRGAEKDIADADLKIYTADQNVKRAEAHLAKARENEAYLDDLREQYALDEGDHYLKGHQEGPYDPYESWMAVMDALPGGRHAEGRNNSTQKVSQEVSDESTLFDPADPAHQQAMDEAGEFGKFGTLEERTYIHYDNQGQAVGGLRVTLINGKHSDSLITVRPDLRRQGIGGKLAQAAQDDGIPMHRLASAETMTTQGYKLRRGQLAKEIEKLDPMLGHYVRWLDRETERARRVWDHVKEAHEQVGMLKSDLAHYSQQYDDARAAGMKLKGAFPQGTREQARINAEIDARLEPLAQRLDDIRQEIELQQRIIDHYPEIFRVEKMEVYQAEREAIGLGADPRLKWPGPPPGVPKMPTTMRGAKRQVAAAKGQVTKAKKFKKRLQARRKGLITHFNKATKFQDDAEREFEKLAAHNEALAPYLRGTTKMQANYHVHTIASRDDAWAKHMAENPDARPIPDLIPLRSDGVTPTFASQSTLPDTRLTGFSYEANPLIPAAQRSRQSATKSMFANRIKALDDAHGKSSEEVRTGVAHVNMPNGETRMVDPLDITPHYIDGQVTHYEYAVGGDLYILQPNQVWMKDGMIPTGTDLQGVDRYYDPHTGWEWQRLSENIGHPMVQEIIKHTGSERWWPVHILKDTIHENLWAAGGEVARAGSKELFDQGMEHAMGKALSTVRFGVTQYFPAYHMRNLTSDALMSLQADTGVIFHPIANFQMGMLAALRRKSPKVSLPGIEQDLDPAEALFIMDQFGLTSSQHLAEFAHLSSTWGAKEPSKFWLSAWNPGPKGKLGRLAIDLGARREDMVRFMTFRQRLTRNGGDVADATWHSVKHHFDYADLSHVERTKIRNLFLFYTWYRKNIPLQFQQLISRPGFFVAVGHTYEDLPRGETPLNVNWGSVSGGLLPDLEGEVKDPGLVPNYLIDQLGAALVNWNGHTAAFATGAPWNDMALVSNLFTPDYDTSLRSVVSMANPLAGIALSYGYDTDPLTGAEIKDRSPVPEFFDTLIPGDLPKDDEGRPTLPSWITTAINYIPFAGRGIKYFGSTTAVTDPGFAGTTGKQIGMGLLGINSAIYPNKDQPGTYNKAWENRYRGILGEYNFETLSGHNNMNTLYDNRQTKQDIADLRREVHRAQIPRGVVSKIEEGNPFYLTQEERARQNQRRRQAETGEKYLHPHRHAKDKPEKETPDFSPSSSGSLPDFSPDSGGKSKGGGFDFTPSSESGFTPLEKPEEKSYHEQKVARHTRREYLQPPEPLGPRKPWQSREDYAIKQAKRAGEYAIRVASGPDVEAPDKIRLGMGKNARPASEPPTASQGASRDVSEPQRTKLTANRPLKVAGTAGNYKLMDKVPPGAPQGAYEGSAIIDDLLTDIGRGKAAGVATDKDVQLAKDPNERGPLKKAYAAVNDVLGMVNAPKQKQIVQLAKEYVQAYNKAQPEVKLDKYADLGPAAPELAGAAVKYGKEFGIDPSFLMGIAEIETGFGAAAGSGTAGAGAVSSAGAQGYMQFMPDSRDQVLEATGYDAFSKDPAEAMAAAAGYFSVFAPDAKSNYDRAYSYNHADWYANDVLSNAEKYKELDNMNPQAKGKAQPIPTQLKLSARRYIGREGLQLLKQGGKIVPYKKQSKKKLQTEELFYDGADKYYTGGSWVDGQFGDHADHVHFASKDPISMMLVIKHAQDIGLLQPGSGENPLIDVVDAPAHTDASLSFHNYTEPLPDTKKANQLYKQVDGQGNEVGQAVDMAGDPALMDEMRSWIEKHMSEGVNPYAGAVRIKGSDLMVAPPPPETSATAPSTGAATGASGSVPTTPSTGGMPAPTGTGPISRGQNGIQMPKGLLDTKALKLGRFSSRFGDTTLNPGDYYGFTNPADNAAQAASDTYGLPVPGASAALDSEIEALVEEDDRARYGF